MIAARNWESLLANDRIGLDVIFAEAVCSTARGVAADDEGNEDDEEHADDISLLNAVVGGKAPSWWPSHLPRIAISVRVVPEDQHPAVYPDQSMNLRGKSLGKRQFMAALERVCRSVGTPFHGRVEINVRELRTNQWVAGWSGIVEVSTERRKKEEGKKGESLDDQIPEGMRWMLGHLDKVYEGQRHAMGQVSNALTSSAHVINAMRGVNAAPPWMNQGEGGEDDMPAWARLALEAMSIASKTTGEGEGVVDAARQIANDSYRQPGAPQRRSPQALQLSGPVDMQGPPGSNYAWDHPEPRDQVDAGYGPKGDYDGVMVADGDVLDDGFNDGFEDGGGYYEDNVEDFEEEYEEDHSGSVFSSHDEAPARRSGNPLDDMDPDELFSALNDYIDKNPQHRGRIKAQGKKLAMKLL